MGGFPRSARPQAGFSMIEVMIAGGLIAFIAVAMMPAIFNVVDQSKPTGFKAMCAGMVHAKLQEYKNGVADTTTLAGTSYTPTGFEYTKSRYRAYYPGICTMSPSAGAPGIRESVFGTTANFGGAEYTNGSGSSPAGMMGFQLWVNVRRYNPRKPQVSGTSNAAGQATRDCPFADYQFYSIGDALEVTVTGMVRTDPAVSAGGRGGAALGKLKDTGGGPNPLLTCSATEIIYPPRVPFRYYLGSDGKIRNLQASIAYAQGVPGATKHAAEAHFRNVWVTGGNSTTNVDTEAPIANIRSFAVSPDNQWIYILRPGELSRFGPCYDTPTTVYVNGVAQVIGNSVTLTTGGSTLAFAGMPDCPTLPSRASFSTNPGPDNLRWTVPLTIENIAVDFGNSFDNTTGLSLATDDKVYAMYNSDAAFTGNGGNNGLLKADDITAATLNWSESSTFQIPANRPRIRGMFIGQTFGTTSSSNRPNLFFFDNTCYTGGSTQVKDLTYCTSVFNAGDTTMQQDVRELPTQVEAISF